MNTRFYLYKKGFILFSKNLKEKNLQSEVASKWMQRHQKKVSSCCLLIVVFLVTLPLMSDWLWSGENALLRAWFTFFGEFHPVIVHLPIGSCLLLILLELYYLIKKREECPSSLLIIFFTAFCGVIAVIVGQFSYLAANSPASLEGHLREGILFAVLCLFLFLFKFHLRLKKRTWVQVFYLLTLSFTGLVLISAAHQGGVYTHGELLDKAPWREPENQKKERKDIAKKQSTAKDPKSTTAKEVLLYEDVIEPLFAKHCYHCHGEKKDKGGFRMHNWNLLKEGLDKENPLHGDILYTLLLPLDDEEHMPPAKEEQLTEQQVKLIRWWAENGHPRNKTTKELNVPKHLLSP